MLSFISQGMALKKNSYLPENAHIASATLKKFKVTRTVANLPGRGPMLILPPRTVRRENYRGK